MRYILLILLLVNMVSYGQKGPGGVSSNIVLWLDATEISGNNNQIINNWVDKSNSPITLTGHNSIRLQTNYVNRQNALYFNGTSQYFQAPFASKLTPSNLSIFTVNKISSTGSYKAVLSNRDDKWGASTQGYILYGVPSSNHWQFWTGNYSEAWRPVSSGISTVNSWSSQTMVYKPYNTNNPNKWLYVNNLSRGSARHLMNHNTDKPFRIGAGYNEGGAQYFFKGYMSEIIMYNTAVNSAQMTIINNYLSAKYGFALSSKDYYTMDNSGYDYDVTGIGRDNRTNQHRSSTGTGIISISRNSLKDGQYLFTGSNREYTVFNNYNLGPACYICMDRIWGVTNRGGVKKVSLSFNFTISKPSNVSDEVYIIIDRNKNGDYNDETPIRRSSQAGNIVTFNGIQLNNGETFTLAVKGDEITTQDINK